MTILKFGILLNNNFFSPPNESTLQSSTATELRVGQTTLLFTSREDKGYKGSLCQLLKGGDLTIFFLAHCIRDTYITICFTCLAKQLHAFTFSFQPA